MKGASFDSDIIFRRELLKKLDKIAEEIKEAGKNVTDKLDAIKSRVRVIK
jgi:hypothetical protein